MSVLDDARALLATGPLCDSCLGRPVADRSHGLRNEERGRALRVTVALADDEPFDSPPTEDCWVCEGLCTRFDAYAERAADELDGVDLYTYQVGTRVPPLVEENGRLLREDAGLPADAGEALNSEFNREVGRRLGGLVDASVDFERPDVQVLLDLAPGPVGSGVADGADGADEADEADGAEGEVEVRINSLSIYGRYRKLERGIPQTEWDKYETSVEELVAPPALSAFRGTEAVFHGAGREDVDARMVGTGRPFVLEIEEPRRRNADLDELESEITEHAAGSVEVEGMRFASYEMIERVKELPASKTYRMEVEFGEPVAVAEVWEALDELDGATIQQRTPNRVAHRRADRVRERRVYDADVEFDGGFDGESDADGGFDGESDVGGKFEGESDVGGESDGVHRATVTIHGEGGLYVKELVSGDDGRTRPNLAGLLDVDAEVRSLDVVAVEGEEEPFEDPEYFRDGG